MIIKPKVRGFMCTTAHPVGCAANVRRQVDFVRMGGEYHGPKRALVLGASTGYGLASRISAAFGAGAETLGVFFEKEGGEKRCATAGWYNAAAFHQEAQSAGLEAMSINGDAFSNSCKERVIEILERDYGPVDLVVYSLAAPRRTHPITGVVHKSTLKPIGKSVTERTLDTDKREVKRVSLAAATEEEIADTVAVMGGEDWEMWIDALDTAGLIASGCKTTAYTYLGERVTWPIYWEGTIGQAKQDLDRRVQGLRERLAPHGGDARVAVLKAVVTQASSAIPIMPLYLSLLFKVMKSRGTHEGCIEQADGLLRGALYGTNPAMDDAGRLRMDGKELDAAVQREIEALWPQVTTENLHELADFDGYQAEFLQLFGFGIQGVDYDADVNPQVAIGDLVTL